MKVKWGVLGAAGIADRRTIPGMLLADNAELVAVMEVNMELAEKIRGKYNAKKAYDTADKLIADPEIEAVYIASPVVFHKEQAIKAAGARKHLLIEKPIALTSEEGLEVLKICRKEGVLAASGFMMRCHAYHQKMKSIVQSGKLGDLVSCRAQLTCWYPELEGAWRQKKALSGGGAMMDLGVHCIDLLQYITGKQAKKVTGFSGNKTFHYEVEDSAAAVLELEDNVYAYVDANFNIPDAAARCRMEIYGTRGSLMAEGTIGQVEGGRVETYFSEDPSGYNAQQDRSKESAGLITAELGNLYMKEIQSFGESVLMGKPLEVPAEAAIQVQKVVEALYASSAGGRTVILT